MLSLQRALPSRLAVVRRCTSATHSLPLPPPSSVTVVTRSVALTDLASPLAFLVDKPKGWTSFDVCAKIKGALRIRKHKVGHAGTLDPMATGLVIVCTGAATKFVDSFQAQVKTYSGTLRLGEATPSYDADTAVSESSEWRGVSDEELHRAATHFLGDIEQIPPMFSALKQNGVRLYAMARKGEEVERKPRALHVSRFDVRRESPSSQDVHFSVICSKGTYVRSLAHDLGKLCGTHAHLTALRREAIGEHAIADAWELSALVAAIQAARPQDV